MQYPNFHGSFTQSATAHVGYTMDPSANKLQDVYKPISQLMPMANPCEFDISGWDINSADLFAACKRAHVLEPTLVNALKEDLEKIKPLPSVLNPEFIAAN